MKNSIINSIIIKINICNLKINKFINLKLIIKKMMRILMILMNKR